MKNTNIVFCMNIGDDNEPQNDYFRHEADIVAAAVAEEVEGGKLTPEEARELLEPYRDVLPPLYTDSQKAIFDPKRQGWNDPDFFPKTKEILRSPQASQIFWYEADELGIEGVELFWSTPFPLLDSVSENAMGELQEAMKGRYEITVKDEIHDTSEFIEECLRWARERIKDADFGKDSQSSESASDNVKVSGTERVKQLLDDPDFEAGRYIDDDVKDLQSGDLVRICLVENVLQAHLIEAIGVVVSTSGDNCTLDVDGRIRVFERGDIELMPTGFNPHYGGEQ